MYRYLFKGRTTKELYDLNNRCAIVTGGAGEGYGAQIVEALGEAGAQVIITSRDLRKAVSKARWYKKEKKLKVEGRKLNLDSENNIIEFFDELNKKYKEIDILVNNATQNKLISLEKISLNDWNEVFSVNITGTMILTRSIAQNMLKRKSGTIINISSIYGFLSPDQRIYGNSGLNSPLIYGITKAALIQMTRYLATYWAPYIRVNCISPGGLFNNQPSDFIEKYEDKTPLGRMAGPDDLKGIALFLASDASKWITGQNYIVDGGWSIW